MKRDTSNINLRSISPQLHKAFKASCGLAGISMKDELLDHMRRHSEAALRAASSPAARREKRG